MKTQKIINLLNSSEDKISEFATKKWYVIDSKSKDNYSHHDPTNFLTKSVESSLYDYSDACILFTGNIAATRTIAVPACSPAGTQPPRKENLTAARQEAFKICEPFKD